MSLHVLDTANENTSTRKASGRSTKMKQSASMEKTRQSQSRKNSRRVSTIKSIGASPEKLAIAFTTLALLAVSAFDLAKGIELLTGCQTWQAWALTFGIDS